MPHSPPNLLGVANLRGTVLPVVSLGGMLGTGTSQPSRSTRVVVIKGKTPVGLLVDDVAALREPSDARQIDLAKLLGQTFRLAGRKALRADRAGESSETQPEKVVDERTFLAFRVAAQEYALPIEDVLSIAATPSAVARLPRTDAAMLGVAEIGGALVPLVSARVLLGFPDDRAPEDASRIVLARLGESFVGIEVDSMKEIIRATPEQLDTVPPVLTRARGEAQVEAIYRLDDGHRLISILSTAKLFDSETITRVLAQAELGAHQMPSGDTAAEAVQQFIVFQLGEESYGLPIRSVDEIVRSPDTLTRVPKAPKFIRGLMNLRGKALPVIDQRERFAVPGSVTGVKQRVIVVTIDAIRAGFLVDSVSQVLTISEDSLSPAPEFSSDTARVIDRVATIERDGRMILLVDPKVLLDKAERDLLEQLGRDADAADKP
jgi:purine-binding chemotaxis protein CheW